MNPDLRHVQHLTNRYTHQLYTCNGIVCVCVCVGQSTSILETLFIIQKEQLPSPPLGNHGNKHQRGGRLLLAGSGVATLTLGARFSSEQDNCGRVEFTVTLLCFFLFLKKIKKPPGRRAQDDRTSAPFLSSHKVHHRKL